MAEKTPSVSVDLELVSTDDLIRELANRHKEIIVIWPDKKNSNEGWIFVKTVYGKKGLKDKGFDLIEATKILHFANTQLIQEYLEEGE